MGPGTLPPTNIQKLVSLFFFYFYIYSLYKSLLKHVGICLNIYAKGAFEMIVWKRVIVVKVVRKKSCRQVSKCSNCSIWGKLGQYLKTAGHMIR